MMFTTNTPAVSKIQSFAFSLIVSETNRYDNSKVNYRYTPIENCRLYVTYMDNEKLDVTKMLCHIFGVLSKFVSMLDYSYVYVRFGYMRRGGRYKCDEEYKFNINDWSSNSIKSLFDNITFDSTKEPIKKYKYEQQYIPPEFIGFDIDTKREHIIERWNQLPGYVKLYETEKGYHAYIDTVDIHLIKTVIGNYKDYGLDLDHIALQIADITPGVVFTEQWRITNKTDNFKNVIESDSIPLDVNLNLIKLTIKNLSEIIQKLNYELIWSYTNHSCNLKIKFYYNSFRHTIIGYNEETNTIITNDSLISTIQL